MQAFQEAHKWVVAAFAIVFTPALLVIHLPVSLLLIGNASEAFYAATVLMITHIAFALAGNRLSPPVDEMQWLLLRAGAGKLLFGFCLLHFRTNFVYWGVWAAPLLLLVFSGKAFSFPAYLLWLLVFTLEYVLAVLILALFKYRAVFFATGFRGIPGAEFLGRHPWLVMAAGHLLFSYALLDVGQWLVWRCVSAVGAAMLLVHGINRILEEEAETLFWMHAKSCSRVYLLVSGIIKGLLLALPGMIFMSRLLEASGLIYCLGFMLATGVLGLLSLWPRGRSLLGPGMVLVALGLLAASG